MTFSLDVFVTTIMVEDGVIVPARIQAALALLERLRTHASLKIADHLARANSSRVERHTHFAEIAFRRMSLQSTDKNYGQWSSKIADWGQQLLDGLRDAGLADNSDRARSALIDFAQAALATALRSFCEREPLAVRISGRSAEAVIDDILCKAEAKGKRSEVARSLVGAVLAMRHGGRPSPAPNHRLKSIVDVTGNFGDDSFRIGDTYIWVVTVLPTQEELRRVSAFLGRAGSELWVLARQDHVETWKTEFRSTCRVAQSRAVVRSVESSSARAYRL